MKGHIQEKAEGKSSLGVNQEYGESISHTLGGWTVRLPCTWWFWTLHDKLIKSQEQMLGAAAEADSFVFTAHNIVMTTDHVLVSTWKT